MTTSGFGRMGIGMLDAEILIEPYVLVLLRSYSLSTVFENAKTYLLKCPIKYRYEFSMYQGSINFKMSF